MKIVDVKPSMVYRGKGYAEGTFLLVGPPEDMIEVRSIGSPWRPKHVRYVKGHRIGVDDDGAVMIASTTTSLASRYLGECYGTPEEFEARYNEERANLRARRAALKAGQEEAEKTALRLSQALGVSDSLVRAHFSSRTSARSINLSWPAVVALLERLEAQS